MGLNTVPAVAGLTYKVDHLTSSGTWTAPSNVSMVDIFMVGGGQGGTGITVAATASSANWGYPAGAGAIVHVKDYPVTPGASMAYTIGAGGAGGVATGTTAALFYGSAGGTTTFGNIKAPGACVKLGNRGASVSTANRYRGGWGIIVARDGGGATGNESTAISQSSWDSSDAPILYGFPEGFNSFVEYTDFYAANGATVQGANYPQHHPGGGGASTYNVVYSTSALGVNKNFSRLLNGLTAPQGTSGGLVAGRTSGSFPAGWGGFGGASTGDPTGYYAGYGAGSGAVGQYNVGATLTGGTAGTNSGSGGGGGAASNPATGFTARNANGGAGGSGVIVIGYWG